MHVVHICDVYNVSIVLVAYEFHAFKMKRLKRRNDQNIYILILSWCFHLFYQERLHIWNTVFIYPFIKLSNSITSPYIGL